MTTLAQLDAFALKALEDPQTYVEAQKHKKLAWTAIEEAVCVIKAHLETPVSHPEWDHPLLTRVLVEWACDDPRAYAAFMGPISKEDRAQDLGTLPGMWNLDYVVRSLSDDHDFVLQSNEEHFRLTHEGSIKPWQPLVGMTELAQAVLARRGLPVPEMKTAPVLTRKSRRSRSTG